MTKYDYFEDSSISWGAKGVLTALLMLAAEKKDPICVEEVYSFMGGDDEESDVDDYLREIVTAGYVRVGEFYIGDGEHESRIIDVLSSKGSV